MYIYVYSEVGWIRRVDLPMNWLCLIWSHKELGLGYFGIFDIWVLGLCSTRLTHDDTWLLGLSSARFTCRYDVWYVLWYVGAGPQFALAHLSDDMGARPQFAFAHQYYDMSAGPQFASAHFKYIWNLCWRLRRFEHSGVRHWDGTSLGAAIVPIRYASIWYVWKWKEIFFWHLSMSWAFMLLVGLSLCLQLYFLLYIFGTSFVLTPVSLEAAFYARRYWRAE